MIQRLFLPEKLFGVRLLPERIIGIALDRTLVHLVEVQATRSKTIIEVALFEPITEGPAETFAKRAAMALKNIMSRITTKPDQIRIAIPATFVVFKEMSLPFTDREKIRSVLDFEIEPLLPFPPADAIIDFIITNEGSGDKDAQLLVAAIRRHDLAEILAIYTQAGIEPTNITVDLFALHSLYQQIPEYAAIKEGSALVDMGSFSSRIAFLQNGKMRIIRTFPKGLYSLVRSISEEAKVSEDEIKKALQNGALAQKEQTALNAIIQKYFINYLNDIQFTLNSFSLTLKFYGSINKILFSGHAASINGFDAFATQVLQTSCEFFAPEKLFQLPQITNNVSSIAQWTPYTLAIAIALPTESYDAFNLRRREFAPPSDPLMLKQLYAACALIIIMFSIVAIFQYLEIRRLSSVINTFEQKELIKLKKLVNDPLDETFNKSIKDKLAASKQLKSFVASFKTELNNEDEIWGYITKHAINPLKILYDLTRTIDRASYNIVISSTEMKRDATLITLVEVSLTLRSKEHDENDWQAFTKFTESLRKSKYFTLGEYREEVAEEGGVRVILPLYVKE